MLHEASADYGTVVPQNAVALISYPDGRLHIVSPGGDAPSVNLPVHQAVLFAIAQKLTDPDWIDELIEELCEKALAK